MHGMQQVICITAHLVLNKDHIDRSSRKYGLKPRAIIRQSVSAVLMTTFDCGGTVDIWKKIRLFASS